MQAKRIVTTTSSSLFLTPERPVYINRVPETFRLEEHRHEFVEINYVSEGSGYQHIGDRSIPVTMGDLFFLPIGASHVFRPASPSSNGRSRLIVYNCLFLEAFAARLLDAYGMDEGAKRLLTTFYPEQSWLHVRDRDGLFHRAFNVMYEEYLRRNPGYLAIMQAEIVRVVVHIDRFRFGSMREIGLTGDARNRTQREEEGSEVSAVGAAGGNAHSDAFDSIAERIRREPEETISMSALAAEAGLSERQFRRRFTERAGMSFTDLVHKCRIEASCALLDSTGDKVATIAQRVGYQDIKFFNRLFKRKTGMTPRQYRSGKGQGDSSRSNRASASATQQEKEGRPIPSPSPPE